MEGESGEIVGRVDKTSRCVSRRDRRHRPATDMTMGGSGAVHNVVGYEVARQGECLCLANVCPLVPCEVRGRRGKGAAGKTEVFQALSLSFAMSGTFLYRVVVRGPGFRVARSLVCASKGVGSFVPCDSLVSGDPLKKDVEIRVGTHVGWQVVFDVCRYGVS